MMNSLRFLLIILSLSGSAPMWARPAYGAAMPQSLLGNVVDESQPESAEPPADSSDDARYADGTRAIQESRWADAASIFAKVAEHRGPHTEGSLYWKAYAENKQGNSDAALKTCGSLRQSYPRSQWIDDCGALEIEIRGKSGQPVDPQSEHDENLKLLALNAQMHRDESKALPQIQQILAGNQPETFKEQALFVLAQSDSVQARKMLAAVASPDTDAPANIRSNATLRQRAQQLLAASQSSSSATTQPRRPIGIDVVASNATGNPVYGLNASDFTVLDNGQQQKILTFHGPADPASHDPASGDANQDTEVLIVIDTINESLLAYPYVRDEVEAYLKSNGGALKHPTSVFIFDGTEALRLAPASKDGNALAAAVQSAGTGRRPIRRSSGGNGVLPRAQMSLGELGSLAVTEAARPGRKMLLWISPGWDTAGFDDDWMLDDQARFRDQAPLFHTRKSMFAAIVALSTGLRQARIQLYCIKPDHTAGSGTGIWSRYQLHLKGVANPDKAGTGDLGLQVLAVQSGGLAVNNANQYLSGVIAQTVESSEADYFLSFEASRADHADEFHSLKVTVNKPGLTIRTRHGYYQQP